MLAADVFSLQASSSVFVAALSLVFASVVVSFPVSSFSLLASVVSEDKLLSKLYFGTVILVCQDGMKGEMILMY